MKIMKAYCKLCGRQITDPTSIRRGMGSTCYNRYVTNLKRLEAQEESEEGHGKNICGNMQGKISKKETPTDRKRTAGDK